MIKKYTCLATQKYRVIIQKGHLKTKYTKLIPLEGDKHGYVLLIMLLGIHNC